MVLRFRSQLLALVMITPCCLSSDSWAVSLEQAYRVAVPSRAFYQACADKKLMKVTAQARPTDVARFEAAHSCDPGTTIAPRIGYLGDIQKVSDRILLKEYALLSARKQLEVLEKQNEIMENGISCLETLQGNWSAPASESCAKSVALFRDKILPQVGPFRRELALSLETHSVTAPNKSIDVDHPGRHLNLAMAGLPMTVLDENRSAAETDETQEITSEWKKELLKIRERFIARAKTAKNLRKSASSRDPGTLDWNRRLEELEKKSGLEAYKIPWPAWQSYARAELERFKNEKKRALDERVERFRILALLKSSAPSPGEVADTLRRMISDKKKEIQEISDLRKEVEDDASPKANSAILGLTSKPAYNMMALNEEKRFCSVAESLELHRKEYDELKTIGKTFAVTTAYYLVPYLFPHGVAQISYAVVSTVAGVGYNLYDLTDKADTKTREALSYIEKDETLPMRSTTKEAANSQEWLALQWAMVPIQAAAFPVQVKLFYSY